MKKIFQGFSPFVVVGIVLILVPIFVLMTVNNIREQKERTIEKLTGKGIFLIRAFEAGTRTGMMSMEFGVARVQRLLTETALQPEVAYMMITKADGRILAHSNPERVGGLYENMPDISTLNEPTILQHRAIFSVKDGIEPVFQVFKKFTPAHRRSRKGRPLPPWCMGEGNFPGCIPPVNETIPSEPSAVVDSTGNSNALPEDLDEINDASSAISAPESSDISKFSKERDLSRKMDWLRAHFFNHNRELMEKNHPFNNGQIIFAALDMSEVQRESKQYLRHAIVMGVMFFILCCAGIVSVLAIQGYRSVRSSLDRMKEEVERSRRLAAVGKLAAGVAHEIRNPLSSIKGFATWFRERYSSVDEDREVADVMIQEVERLNRAVTQLLELSKPLPVNKIPISIEETLAHSIKLIARELNEKGMDVVVQVDASLKHKNITTDPDLLNQILLNLYLNAMQAMEDKGGKLEVLVTEAGSGASKAVLLKVSDTGRGIETADLEHIFDPYFTNRPGGTGLGLAMVHRAIEALGAEIRVESQKGQGTRFFIRLPVDRRQR
ncbi:putative Histidine kinase [Desulfamplus magnetovallimortis]|uniref:Sensor histidine kinase ZraS n=1 Tax=Desulfamplus magnetovallimortis TaxID=1246637 RepID=A0A1W1HB09_9BACT|nr:ATP-binding protein [Desulfamplus magnetovallimortis]SLM29626.1 putative Histidine kinase [Desulfamplus magnetovallimortis]